MHRSLQGLCSNGRLDSAIETGTDCGGLCIYATPAKRCPPGTSNCDTNSNCISGRCVGGNCVACTAATAATDCECWAVGKAGSGLQGGCHKSAFSVEHRC